jgi:hypothetical protein
MLCVLPAQFNEVLQTPVPVMVGESCLPSDWGADDESVVLALHTGTMHCPVQAVGAHAPYIDMPLAVTQSNGPLESG